ncbi:MULTISPECIES: FAD-dependent oxidoreductase [Aerosakkonema]|uniref:FAD-dependent oxidoreductase n=1 Tax=Aerosakkonema TaxID=1246629 RepID=UPI0035B7118D
MVKDACAYDVIGFGDEVPGILALICAAREYRRRTNKYPRVLLISNGNLQAGIGGHLVRGGLAYLDRTQIDRNFQQSQGLDRFGDPAPIYKEFLHKSGVIDVGLDPRKASEVLRQMLREAGVDILTNVGIRSVTKEGDNLASITLANDRGIFSAKQFIDSTVNAELAQAAGVRKLKGFETFCLPESELAVTLVFETKGLTPSRITEIEYRYLKRFTNLSDTEGQTLLLYAAGFDVEFAEALRKEMLESNGDLKTLQAGTDYIDIRSTALSVGYHSFRRKKFCLAKTGVILDRANIAILGDDRLSWNALLIAVTADEAEALAKASAKPTPKMLAEIAWLEKWFKSLGATAVTPAKELYIRHAGNITGVVEPLTGTKMLMGGVPENESIGTFAYHFDARGEIKGISQRANAKGFSSVRFPPPVFHIGIQHALVKYVPNLAVVSPASGFEGYASTAGRIVEFNSAVGQGVGIAAVIAILDRKNLANVSNSEVREVMRETNQLPKLFGMAKIEEASQMRSFESEMAIA